MSVTQKYAQIYSRFFNLLFLLASIIIFRGIFSLSFNFFPRGHILFFSYYLSVLVVLNSLTILCFAKLLILCLSKDNLTCKDWCGLKPCWICSQLKFRLWKHQGKLWMLAKASSMLSADLTKERWPLLDAVLMSQWLLPLSLPRWNTALQILLITLWKVHDWSIIEAPP